MDRRSDSRLTMPCSIAGGRGQVAAGAEVLWPGKNVSGRNPMQVDRGKLMSKTGMPYHGFGMVRADDGGRVQHMFESFVCCCRGGATPMYIGWGPSCTQELLQLQTTVSHAGSSSCSGSQCVIRKNQRQNTEERELRACSTVKLCARLGAAATRTVRRDRGARMRSGAQEMGKDLRTGRTGKMWDFVRLEQETVQGTACCSGSRWIH